MSVPKRGIDQLAGYILFEAPSVDKTALREWVETWLNTWCPVVHAATATVALESKAKKKARKR